MADCEMVYTPTPLKPQLSSTAPATFSNPHLYRKIVDSLQYLTIRRPDIACSVNKLCQHMHSPQHSHFQLLKRLLRYINGIILYGFSISSGRLSLTAYSDADWADDSLDRR